MFLQPSWYSEPGTSLSVNADARAALLLNVKELFKIDALGIVDIALRVAHRDDLAAELSAFLSRVLRDVAGAGDDDGLALIAVVSQVLESLGGEVAQAVAGGLSARKRAAVAEPLPVSTPPSKRSTMRLYWPKR